MRLDRRRLMIAPGLLALATVFHRAPAAHAQTEATPDPDKEMLTLSLYSWRNDELAAAHRLVPKPADKRVAAAALTALLDGPTADEREAGLSTVIADKQTFAGVELETETAVAAVDLGPGFVVSDDPLVFERRLAQVVFTLTQFPTITQVRVLNDGRPIDGGDAFDDGEPLGRDHFERHLPAIFVESPAVGDVVGRTLTVTGTANTFEATFQASVEDADGTVLLDEPQTATSGNGVRGTFETTLTLDLDEAQPLALVVYEVSARDGSRENEVSIPLTFDPEA